MSYEGMVQMVCANRHESMFDAREDIPGYCPHVFCRARWEYRHDIDTTNGYSEEHASTCKASLKCVGFDDFWTRDRHGTIYAASVARQEINPDDLAAGVWKRVEWTEEDETRDARAIQALNRSFASLLEFKRKLIMTRIATPIAADDILRMNDELRLQLGATSNNPNDWPYWLLELVFPKPQQQ